MKQKFGKRVKEFRVTKDLTQEELAEKLKLSPKSLSQIELGYNFVSAETLEKLCDTLNISPKVLFDFDYLEEEPSDLINDIVNRLDKNPERLKDIHKILIALES